MKAKAKLLDAFRNKPLISIREALNITQVTRTYLAATLRSLVEEGTIVRVSRGVYSLSPSRPAPITPSTPNDSISNLISEVKKAIRSVESAQLEAERTQTRALQASKALHASQQHLDRSKASLREALISAGLLTP